MSVKERDIFVTTRWTAVLRAGGSGALGGAGARDALAELCQTYWFPLYAYVRRRASSPEDAEDLTQGFFARLLRLESLGAVSRERGKFRAFLLASMNNYLAGEHERGAALKRAAGKTISLESAEARYRLEPVDHLTPERCYERQWALTLLETVVGRLCGEYEAAGRGAIFRELRFAITSGEAALRYEEVAARLGLSEPNVKVTVHRLRRRYRQVLHEEIAQTLEDPSEVDAELRYLRKVLSAHPG